MRAPLSLHLDYAVVALDICGVGDALLTKFQSIVDSSLLLGQRAICRCLLKISSVTPLPLHQIQRELFVRSVKNMASNSLPGVTFGRDIFSLHHFQSIPWVANTSIHDSMLELCHVHTRQGRAQVP